MLVVSFHRLKVLVVSFHRLKLHVCNLGFSSGCLLLLSGLKEYQSCETAEKYQEAQRFRVLTGTTLTVDSRKLKSPPDSCRVRPRDPNMVNKIKKTLINNTKSGTMVLGIGANVNHLDQQAMEDFDTV